jgi:hypothetical protein
MGQVTEGLWTYIIENGGATITGSTATGAVTIPSELGGYPVKKVGNQWPPIFGWSNPSVSSITIPSSVTSIGDYAFYNCRSLNSITIPSSVTSIGSGAFSGCSLVSVQFSEGLRYIGEGAFEYTGISEITLPESLEYIGNRNFVTSTYVEWEFVWSPYKRMNIHDKVLPFLTSMCSYYDDNNNNYQTAIPLKLNVTYGGSNYINSTFLSRVASNTDFISALAANDAFVTAVANKIKGTVGTYGLATQSELGALATKSEITTAINEGRAAGIASVTASPNTWSLFTSSQIQNMAIGDLVLTREVNGNFVLNYDIEQSEDLANWTVYSANRQIVKLPADKAFVRIKAKQ